MTGATLLIVGMLAGPVSSSVVITLDAVSPDCRTEMLMLEGINQAQQDTKDGISYMATCLKRQGAGS
jgi:hypothetical protein